MFKVQTRLLDEETFNNASERVSHLCVLQELTFSSVPTVKLASLSTFLLRIIWYKKTILGKFSINYRHVFMHLYKRVTVKLLIQVLKCPNNS